MTKTAVAAPEEEPMDYYCPVYRERWSEQDEGHSWEFKPSGDETPDKLECPFAEAAIIGVRKFGQ